MAHDAEHWEDPALQAAVDAVQRPLRVTSAFYSADENKYKIQHETFHPLVCVNSDMMFAFHQSRRLGSSHAEPVFPKARVYYPRTFNRVAFFSGFGIKITVSHQFYVFN